MEKIKRVLCFGSGNMVSALIKAYTDKVSNKISKDQHQSFQIDLYSPSGKSSKKLFDELPDSSLKALIDQPVFSEYDIVILGLKPQQFKEASLKLKGSFKERCIVVSILAGVSLSQIQEGLDHKKVVRLMPNTASEVFEGANTICFSDNFIETEKNDVLSLFAPSGQLIELSEKELSLATIVSGSGPAYVFKLAEIFESELNKQGLDKETAKQLAAQTLYGASKLLKSSELEARELRANVTSKAGVTEAVIKSLETGGFDSLWDQAFESGQKRNLELSGE
ncbi:MAG: pyrroline-5-carboxylate reductase family protein [Bacteriovoracaceae bacterium]